MDGHRCVAWTLEADHEPWISHFFSFLSNLPSSRAQLFPFAHMSCSVAIANFTIEPPGLFQGRGEHPKMGMLKRRVTPDQIIINVSKGMKVSVRGRGTASRAPLLEKSTMLNLSLSLFLNSLSLSPLLPPPSPRTRLRATAGRRCATTTPSPGLQAGRRTCRIRTNMSCSAPRRTSRAAAT